MSVLAVSTSNVTSESDGTNFNISSSADMPTLPPLGPYVQAIHIVLSGMSVVIIVCEILAVWALNRCRRAPQQYLKLSISYLLSDTVAAILFLNHQLLIFGFGLNVDSLHNSRAVSMGVINNITSASLTAIILERVFALKANLKYTLALRKINIHVIILTIWIFHIILPVCVQCISFYQKCSWTLLNCDLWDVSKSTKYFCVGVMIMYEVILVVANAIVYRIARRHARQIDAVERPGFKERTQNTDTICARQYDALKIIIRLVAANLLLKCPLTVTVFVSNSFTSIRSGTMIRILRSLGYFCIQINSFVNMYLYIWKTKECKMMFYFMLAKCFKRYEWKAETLRFQVYDIVVASTRK